jgi:hypothetical protein
MVLRTVAMVLGIIGGVYGLMVGFIGGGITAAFLSSSSNASLIYSGIALLLALAPPIIGVVGAAIVRNKPLLGSSLMGVSSIVMGALGIITFPLGFALVPPAAFFLVGAILGVIGKFQS